MADLRLLFYISFRPADGYERERMDVRSGVAAGGTAGSPRAT